VRYVEREGPSGSKVVTIGGLRIEATRFGQLKVGHRVLEPEEADAVAAAISNMADTARNNRAAIRRPRSERGL
jgi:hypothetical protein